MSEIQKVRNWVKDYWAAHWQRLLRDAVFFVAGIWFGVRFG